MLQYRIIMQVCILAFQPSWYIQLFCVWACVTFVYIHNYVDNVCMMCVWHMSNIYNILHAYLTLSVISYTNSKCSPNSQY